MRVAGIPKVIQDLRQSLRLRVLQLRVVFAGAEVRASRVSDAGSALADRDSDAKGALDAAAGSWTMMSRGQWLSCRARSPGTNERLDHRDPPWLGLPKARARRGERRLITTMAQSGSAQAEQPSCKQPGYPRAAGC